VDLVLLRCSNRVFGRMIGCQQGHGSGISPLLRSNHITRFGLLHDPGKTCAHDEIWARHRYWEPSVPPNYYELSQGFG